LLACFVGAWFYGAGVNLVVLLVVAGLLLLAFASSGRDALRQFTGQPLPIGLALGSIAALFIAHLFARVPEVSLAPSWVLVSLPLAFLVVRGLDLPSGRLLRMGFVTIGITFASISALRFLSWGGRAQLPLADATTYGIFLYLIWIPWVHGQLCREWRGEQRGKLAQAGGHLGSLVLLVSLFATASRACAVVVLVALCLWLIIALVRRMRWHGVAIQIGLALCAWLLVASQSAVPTGLVDAAVPVDAVSGLATRAAMFGSAWQMYLAEPWVGVGVFGFSVLYPSHRSLVDQDSAGLFVHNDYMQLLAEGGLLLAPFAVLMVIAVAVRFVRLAATSGGQRELGSLGLAAALVAACLHANINFVFYSLPLAILAGSYLAFLFPANPTDHAEESVGGVAPWAYAGGLVLGAVAWIVLAIDVAIAGMLLGQPYVPFVADARADQTAVFEFAQATQRLLKSRSVPVLVEARILDGAARTDPQLAELALSAHRRAIEVNPYNPVAFRSMAQHLIEVPHPAGTLRADESVEQMLLRSVSLDPLFYPGVDALLSVYQQTGDQAQRHTLLGTLILPRLTLIKYQDAARAQHYIALLQESAERHGDTAMLAELDAARVRLGGVYEIDRRLWLFGPETDSQD
jgi:O-antigen ligase